MVERRLPDNKLERVDWVIRAEDNKEMRLCYDLWAQTYDSDVGSYDDYLVPVEATKVAAAVLDKTALIVDAGAGTGLVGQTLNDAGFKNLIAVDYSQGMLEVARRKNVYQELVQCDLSQSTDFEAASVDCVITCGTTSQMPCASLKEFVRIVRKGGHIIFGVIPDAWVEFGYAEVYSELAAADMISTESRGKPFQMMPTTEPEFFCEIWVMKVQ